MLAAVAPSANAAADAEIKRPNVIFILADDLGYGDLGCYGQKRIKTPSLDDLAAEGLRFTQAYAGGTVCAPSRCVLMTGLHLGHARVRGNGGPTRLAQSLRKSDVTVARILKDAGYTTGNIGKWGLGDVKKGPPGVPWKHGFDYFFGYLTQGHAHNYYPDYLWRNKTKVTLPNVLSKDPKFKNNVAEKKVTYSHDLFAEDALKFVRDHRKEPFFLYLTFTIPHANNEAGKRGMEVPDYGDYADLDWPNPQKGRAAMISRMDGDIARLMALVKELKLDDKTLVLFSSDNGPGREGGAHADFNDSNGPLRGFKGDLTEGGIRVPLIARWPGRVPAGKASDAPIYFADVMPTLAALCGAQAPDGIDGVDFSPTLCGSEQPELTDRFLYWEFNKDGLQQQASRWRNWKAIRNPRTEKLELYDLTADVGETENIAAQHPEIAAKFDDYFATARTESPDWPVTLAESAGKAAAALSP